MKIGISCYPTFGGSGVVATELAMALAAGGDEVHVISYAMPSRLALTHPNLYFHQVVVPDYPLFEYPPYSLALASKSISVFVAPPSASNSALDTSRHPPHVHQSRRKTPARQVPAELVWLHRQLRSARLT